MSEKETSQRPFYITTAINYPNGPPHIGHAYEAVTSDAIARFHKLAGREVRFQTGVDEHGLKMVKTAREQGKDVHVFADEMTALFKTMCEQLDIGYDKFIRTTSDENKVAAQAIWKAMEASGDLYLGRYEGWYSVRDEAFYGEDELVETEGIKLSPQGTPVEWTAEETWFFRLSSYQQRLLDHYRDHPGFIQPDGRRNEVVRFVEGGLSDLSVSRTSFDWGVPVPGSPGHVMYVWVDALTNYIAGLGYPAGEGNDLWKFWPADVHNIGKDIVRFHAVYWPAFLMSAGIELPRQVFGHGFLLNRGEKMSKSAGNVTDPMALAAEFGVDQLRYFLLREVAFGQDGSYSADAIVTRCNADLANNIGNLAQRSLSMIAKQCGGVLPEAKLEAPDRALLEAIDKAQDRVAAKMEKLSLHGALEAIWEASSEANLYFADQAPWALRKTDPARADTVLYTAAEAVRRLAIMMQWAIPRGSAALLDQLAVAADARDFKSLSAMLEPGATLPEPSGVFPRLAVGEA